MAAWSTPRPVLMLLLLALLCSHIALCSSAAPASKPKTKLSGSRKELLSSDSDDGDEPIKAPKTTAATKIKKKVSPDAKNQTKVVVKGNKSEPTTTAKITKKPTTKAAGDVAIAKPKVPKLDKTTAAKLDKAATAKPADKAATTKPKSTDSASKSTKTGAAKAVKPVKPEGGAPKAKKPSNSTADAGGKPAKSTKKTQVVADVKANSKKNTTVSKETAGVEEDVVLGEEEAEGTEDLMSEFRGLPARLHETLMPDLARLSYTSKAYLSAANAGIAGGVRPILGGRWAAAAASAASVALLLLPLFMLTALVRRMGPYLPLLHRALLLSQAYLAIYFATLALAAAASGLEPLRFFHAASPAAYAWTQAAQSLGFMGYLVLQMVDLVAVFSGAAAPEEDSGGDATKALGLAQMVVGLAVGLHYYAAVFHRAAAGEAPRANWRVYAVYAACFFIICACARAEKRKKAYLAGSDDADEEWKKS